ncbi:MAG: tetratricopeptide repeat protein [Parvularculaceae bacterium]
MTAFSAGAALLGLLLLSAAGQDREEVGSKLVLGADTPLLLACSDNARKPASDYTVLEPCNASLETEPLTPRETAALMVNRGVIYFNLGDYENAVQDFTAALDLDIPDKARVLINRGLAYEALKAERLARLDYSAALAFDPKNEVAKRRLDELDKPAYERDTPPASIEAGGYDLHVIGS